MGKSQKTGIDARLQAFAEWNTQYHQQLKAAGKESLARFDDILSFAYREENTPQQAVDDAKALDRLNENNPLGIQLWHGDEGEGELHLCIYGKDDKVAYFPTVAQILKNLALPALALHDYNLGDNYWLQRYDIDSALNDFQPGDDPDSHFDNIVKAFISVWTGASEDDDLNGYVALCGCDIREIAVLRALGKYLIQAGAPYNYEQIRDALNNNPDATLAFIAAFHAKMQPGNNDANRACRTAKPAATNQKRRTRSHPALVP